MWQFVAGLTFAIMLRVLHLYFRATYKDDANKCVTEKLYSKAFLYSKIKKLFYKLFLSFFYIASYVYFFYIVKIISPI